MRSWLTTSSKKRGDSVLSFNGEHYDLLMQTPILYLGDTSLLTAASYLAGCLAQQGFQFDYLPSEQPISEVHISKSYQLYILSDYPCSRFREEYQHQIVRQLDQGAHLLMVGGWESFQGLGGDWNGSPIGNRLPVRIGSSDDRWNCDQPVFLRATTEHPITANLPWASRPPLIGGLNRVEARPACQVLLTAERQQAEECDGEYRLRAVDSSPLLVVDDSGPGRVTALMTDLAPHWVGPLVDWGDQRVAAQAPGSEAIEVGSLYFQFVAQLIRWAGCFDR